MTDPLGLGPALAFVLHRAGDPPSADWRPLTDRIAEATLRERIDQVRDVLRDRGGREVGLRVAASTEHFGLAARLVAAHVCAAALDIHLDLSAASAWWRQDETGWLQLSFARSPAAVDPLGDTVLTELTARIHRSYGLSSQVLWGNIGSAANSTLTLLRSSRPDLVSAGRTVVDSMLTDARIDGGVLRSGPSFRRSSCCLFYRAGGGLCGDCVLQSPTADRH